MFTVDTHCDTLYMRACQPEMTPCVTPEHLREGNVTVQVCTLWAGPKDPLEDPYSKVMREWAMLPQLTEAGIRLIDKPSDAKDGEHCVLLSMEGGETLGKSLELLHDFRKRGVRLLALTWNYENEIGYPAALNADRRLKPFGWEVVREMEKLGIAADVSHLNEGGFWDLIENAEKPP
ncbi:MAG: membrane dipeptidase, partial [Clostridia bacterium]